FTSKPVMVVGKPIQTILFCQFDLPEMNVLNTKVIKTEFTGQVGLVVTAELGDCPGYISPFRKTFPPPFIVFREGMVLRQIKGNQFHQRISRVITLTEQGHVFFIAIIPFALKQVLIDLCLYFFLIANLFNYRLWSRGSFVYSCWLGA